jgi:hypothetical protein
MTTSLRTRKRRVILSASIEEKKKDPCPVITFDYYMISLHAVQIGIIHE